MAQINWPEALVGFGLGLVPLLARQIYIFVKYVRIPTRRKYLGDWWLYDKSTTGSGSVLERHIRVSYSILLDRLAVKTLDRDQTGASPMAEALQYTGTISGRQGMVRYLFLRDPGSHEKFICYLFDPFYDPIEQTFGLYIALDLQGIPAAGPMLISRKRLSADEATSRLAGDVLRLDQLIR
ncbi:hypothetical protein GCM10022255_087090 [Dactylosporangium darangshiense]|uniref:Uncharacterized protein n=1 Tax=Dactylosporangium darangshiense TaxID=579108 RepID=A0ABP8DN38_9ACTN